jgi:hypothetical protein
LARSRFYISLVVLLIAAAAVSLLALGGSSGSTGTDGLGPSSRHGEGYPPSLRRSFRFLRTTESDPPRSVRSSLEQNLGADESVQITSSYRVNTPLGVAWLVVAGMPPKTAACLVLESSGVSSCSATAAAKRIGLAVGISKAAGHHDSGARRFTAMGVVPNWVRFVKATPLGMPAKVLRVAQNTFAGSASAPLIIREYCKRPHSGCIRPG